MKTRSVVLSLALVGATAVGCTAGTVSGGTPKDGGDLADAAVDGATDAGASAEGGDAGTLSCSAYCAEITANCTGENAQFIANTAAPDCARACSFFPPGDITDRGGQDTLGCRLYHGGTPSQQAPAQHCTHAGPYGGTPGALVCAAPGATNACGAFCRLAVGACTGADQVWSDVNACMTDCNAFTYDSTASIGANGPTTGDTFNCRSYHLLAALSAPNPHCSHLPKVSPICK